jgi:PIN domain nuclease of toxin-antitoxin system
VRILVDTCVFLWLAADDPQLSEVAKAACRDPANEVYFSAISAWEIAIKHRLGRLPLPVPPTEYVSDRRRFLRLEACEFDEVAAAHTSRLPNLHRDPFDRALVAQAITRGMSIATPDPLVRVYPAPTVW